MTEITDEIAETAKVDSNVRLPSPKADMNSLPQRLAAAIAQAGGQLAVARLIGVSSKTLSRYSKGAPPKHSTLEDIARVTNVRLDWLVSGEGPMHPGDPAPAGAAPEPEKPQKTAPSTLFAAVSMDRLALAYTSALQALAASGQYQPDARRIMQVTVLLYDQITASEPPK